MPFQTTYLFQPNKQSFIIKTIMTLSDKGDKKILIDTYAQEKNQIFAFDCHNVWFVNQIKLVTFTNFCLPIWIAIILVQKQSGVAQHI